MFLGMILLLVVAGVVGFVYGRRRRRGAGSSMPVGFVMWALAGLLGPLAVLSMVLGVLVLPIAAVVLFLAAAEHADRSAVGVVAGIGLLVVFLAAVGSEHTTLRVLLGAGLVAGSAAVAMLSSRRVVAQH